MYGFKFGNKDSYFFLSSFNKIRFSKNKNVSFSFLYHCLQSGVCKQECRTSWPFLARALMFYKKGLFILFIINKLDFICEYENNLLFLQ